MPKRSRRGSLLGPYGKNGRLKSHTLHHGRIRDPQNERILDEVLLTIMRKPRSYTGEDVVENNTLG